MTNYASRFTCLFMRSSGVCSAGGVCRGFPPTPGDAGWGTRLLAPRCSRRIGTLRPQLLPADRGVSAASRPPLLPTLACPGPPVAQMSVQNFFLQCSSLAQEGLSPTRARQELPSGRQLPLPGWKSSCSRGHPTARVWFGDCGAGAEQQRHKLKPRQLLGRWMFAADGPWDVSLTVVWERAWPWVDALCGGEESRERNRLLFCLNR